MIDSPGSGTELDTVTRNSISSNLQEPQLSDVDDADDTPSPTTKELHYLSRGGSREVWKIVRKGKTDFVYSETHTSYPLETATANRNLALAEYERCIDFFKDIPTVITKEKWLPLNDSDYQKIRSVKEYASPIKVGNVDASSLGESGLDPNELSEPMRLQIERMIAITKAGVLKAIHASDSDFSSYVPDLRGDNFIFDIHGNLRFVDNGSLADCHLREGVTMTSNLDTILNKLSRLEKKYLGKQGEQLWSDPFYQECLKRYIEKNGITKTKKYFGYLS